MAKKLASEFQGFKDQYMKCLFLRSNVELTSTLDESRSRGNWKVKEKGPKLTAQVQIYSMTQKSTSSDAIEQGCYWNEGH